MEDEGVELPLVKEVSDEPPTYIVEISKSGRAECKKCDSKIDNKTIRVGVLVDGEWGLFTRWQHLDCTVFHKSVVNVESIDGYQELNAEQKLRVSERLEASANEVDEDNVPVNPDELVRKAWEQPMEPSSDLLMPLLPYQKEGLGWMVNQELNDAHGGILADEMGMGKTIQAISLMLQNRPDFSDFAQMREWTASDERHGAGSGQLIKASTLIVLPTVAIRQWQTEIARFTRNGTLTVKVYHGSDRNTSAQDLTTADVVLTSYKILEIEYRKATAGTKVTCRICGKKFYPDKLRVHRKYFCGESAQRTEAQALTHKKQQRVSIPSASAVKKGVGNDAEEDDEGSSGEDSIARQKRQNKEKAQGKGRGTAGSAVQGKGKAPAAAAAKPVTAVKGRAASTSTSASASSKKKIVIKSEPASEDEDNDIAGPGSASNASGSSSELESRYAPARSRADSAVKASAVKGKRGASTERRSGVKAAAATPTSSRKRPLAQISQDTAHKKAHTSPRPVTTPTEPFTSDTEPESASKAASTAASLEGEPAFKRRSPRALAQVPRNYFSEPALVPDEAADSDGAGGVSVDSGGDGQGLDDASEYGGSSDEGAAAGADEDEEEEEGGVEGVWKGRGRSLIKGSGVTVAKGKARGGSRSAVRGKAAVKKESTGSDSGSESDSSSGGSSDAPTEDSAPPQPRSAAKAGAKGKQQSRGTGGCASAKKTGSSKGPPGRSKRPANPFGRPSPASASAADAGAAGSSANKGKGKKGAKDTGKGQKKGGKRVRGGADSDAELSGSDASDGNSNSDSGSSSGSEEEDEEGDWQAALDAEEVEKDIQAAIAEAAQAQRRSKQPPPQSILHKVSWFRIILDEAHLIKDRSTSTAKAVFNLVSLNKWCLTGTPLQNRVGELYSLIRFLRIDPHAFYYCRAKGCACKSLHYRFTQSRCDDCGHSVVQHYCHFNKHILNPIKRSGYVSEGRKAMLKLKQQVLDEILLRRTKTTRAEDIQLPPRIVRVRQEKLDVKEEDFYAALYTQSQAQFNTYLASGTVLNNYAHIFDILIRLRQAVDHPYLVIYSDAQVAAKADSANFLSIADGSTGGGSSDGSGVLIKAEKGDCDLCHEPWEDPVTAQCGHSFCRACITDYIAAVGGNSNGGGSSGSSGGIGGSGDDGDSGGAGGQGSASKHASSRHSTSATPNGRNSSSGGSGGAGVRCPDCDCPLTLQLNVPSSNTTSSGVRMPKTARTGTGGETSSAEGLQPPHQHQHQQGDGVSVWDASKGLSRRSILDRIDLNLFQSSTKIEALMEELYRMQQQDLGAKAIVFSQFVNMLDLINFRLQRGGLGCVKLSGSMNLEQRDRAISAFKTDPDVKVLLISLKAGGVALNLTVASRIFLMDPWWNPAAEMQAIDRTHRIGQHKPIFATRFIIENTIEERILRLQEKKQLVFDGTVGGDAGSMSKLTVDDMRFLFN